MAVQLQGTVTLLFSDIEGSTRLLHELGPERYRHALAEHRRVVRAACRRHGGYEVDYEGDAFFVAFADAAEAVSAAAEAQQGLAIGPVRVRMGLHTGEPLLDPPKYVGIDIHRAARIMGAGHGGQVLLSQATRELLDGSFEVRELGEHRLKDLLEPERLYQIGDGVFPPLRTLYRANLPIQPTPFLGRERELAEVLGLFAETRLLTLTGVGGTGKTRLGLQSAAESAEQYPDGVWWVPLGALRDPTLVLETISQTLEAKEGLAEWIADKRLLLLLDNFEQVIEAAAAVADLLTRCPNLRILVTSREPLHLRAEREYPVPPLADEEAIGFFLDRARAMRPDVEADGVKEICARLDNLPLALELAAARVKALSPAEILQQLERTLPFLIGGFRDLPERQRTLHATIAWSHELLSADEQRLFRRLAAFAGGCTLEAAGQITDADTGTLRSLVEKNLLGHVGDRYTMLETIHEFATEQLDASGEAERCRAAHGDYYVAWAEQAAPRLRGPTQPEWLPRVDAEHDNLRAVLTWSLEARPEHALRVAAALRRYWWARSQLQEGRAWLERLLPIARGRRDKTAVWVIAGASGLAREQGEWEVATALAEEALELALEVGEADQIAGAQHELAAVLDASGADLGRAKALYEESLSRRRASADLVGVVQDLGHLSVLALHEGQIVRARTLLSEALDIARALGDKECIAGTLHNLALVSLEGDEHEVDLAWTRSALRESLELAHELGNVVWISATLETLARTERLRNDDLQAVRLLGAAARLRETVGAPIEPAERVEYEQRISSLRDALDSESFERAWEEGRTMELEEMIAGAVAAG